MIKDPLIPDNHTIIELKLMHVQCCELLVNFTEAEFNITKQDLLFAVDDNEVSAILILSYKTGKRIREVGRVLTRFDEDICCLMIKNYIYKRFIEYLESKKVHWHLVPDE